MTFWDVTSGSGHYTLAALSNIKKLCENVDKKSTDTLFSEDNLQDDNFLHVSDPVDVAMLINKDSMDDECFLNLSNVSEKNMFISEQKNEMMTE